MPDHGKSQKPALCTPVKAGSQCRRHKGRTEQYDGSAQPNHAATLIFWAPGLALSPRITMLRKARAERQSAKSLPKTAPHKSHHGNARYTRGMTALSFLSRIALTDIKDLPCRAGMFTP